MVRGEISQRKKDYRARLEKYIQDYQNILIINVDNVGSRQLQQIRVALRGKASVLLGKNTIMRKVIRELAANDARVGKLLEPIYGNIGFVFTNCDLSEIRNMVLSNKVPAPARAGAVAPIDYFMPAGPTGLDPGQTGFFQALNIATKIVKGAIEIINVVHLIHKDEKVSASSVALLSKLNIKPFFFGVKVLQVYENGSLYDAAILDLTQDDLMKKFQSGVSKLTAVCLQIGYPTASTLPHSIARAFKKVLALSVVSDFSFKEADKIKEYLADPSKFAAAAPAAAAAAAPAAAAKKEVEKESSSDGGALGGGLFGDD